MESNQFFEVEASLGVDEQEQAKDGYRDSNEVVVRTMMAVNGGYDTLLESTTSEESPLLAQEVDAERASGPGDDDYGSGNAKWPGAADLEGLTWWNRPSVYWLLPAYCLYAIALGGIVVPRINLVLSLLCREYFAEQFLADPSFTSAPVILADDNPQCQIPEIQALSTKFLLYTTLISGLLSAISSPKIGTLSDRYGRKPLLGLTACGGLFLEILTILCAKYPDRFHYSWLLIGAVVDGICGSMIASWAMTHSYAADCTAPAKRAVAFGRLHACLFVGIAIGPFIAAFVVDATHSVLVVFYFAFVCHMFFLIYILFGIPESLAKRRQLAAREKYNMTLASETRMFSTLQFVNFLAPLKILFSTSEGSSPQIRTNLLLLSAIDTILFGTAMAAITVVILYSEYEFGWGNKEANLFVSLSNSFRVFALIVILPLLNYVFRTRHKNRIRRENSIVLVEPNSGSDKLDLWTIRASVVFEIVGFGGYLIARTGGLFVMSGVFASIGGIGSPVLQSSLTKHVPHDRTGQLLGATGLLHALARVVWPTGISLIYAYTVKSYPQAVFIVLVGGFVVAFLCSLFIRPHIYLKEPSDTESTE